MIFSKPVLPLVTLLLAAAHLGAGAQDSSSPSETLIARGPGRTVSSEAALTFVSAPSIPPEMYEWLSKKTTATTTTTKKPAASRRAVGEEPKISAFVKAVQSAYSQVLESESSSVSLIPPTEVRISNDVTTTATPVPATEPTTPATDGADGLTNDDNAGPTPEQVAAGEQAYAEAVKENFATRNAEDMFDNEHGKVKRANTGSKSVKNPKSSIEKTSPYQDVGGDPGDGSWWKRSGPGGGRGGNGKPGSNGGASASTRPGRGGGGPGSWSAGRGGQGGENGSAPPFRGANGANGAPMKRGPPAGLGPGNWGGAAGNNTTTGAPGRKAARPSATSGRPHGVAGSSGKFRRDLAAADMIQIVDELLMRDDTHDEELARRSKTELYANDFASCQKDSYPITKWLFGKHLTCCCSDQYEWLSGLLKPVCKNLDTRISPILRQNVTQFKGCKQGWSASEDYPECCEED